jgi:hypothetical protein
MTSRLFDPARHESLQAIAWDDSRVRAAIGHIVADAEARYSPASFWPVHPNDAEGGDAAPKSPLYHGAGGVIWALHHLQALGAATLARDYAPGIEPLLARNRRWLAADGPDAAASYLMGDTGILMVSHALAPDASTQARLYTLIEGNHGNPTRELMWGSPGTMLAALFLFERTQDARFADAFRAAAATLWSELRWSAEFDCHYWTQAMYGIESSYTGAVHGFAATASVLIRGRDLLDSRDFARWSQCIARTVERTATLQQGLANWRAWLHPPGAEHRMLMQFCHGAPGFVICLAGFPDAALDPLLVAGGEATWQAGPLAKGSNLCHGTAGNGYAFLKLYQRTGNTTWLERARAFAMHAIAQMEADERRHGQQRYSLWTGDVGVAIYLWDCLRGQAQFPTLDVFFAGDG